MRRALTTIALALLGSSAWAAPGASATVSLTGLNFQLVDLRPSDSIAPSMSFDYWSQSNVFSLYWPQQHHGMEALMSGDSAHYMFTPGSVSDNGNIARITGNSLFASYTAANAIEDHQATAWTGGTYISGASDWGMELSPYTRVVLSGYITLDVANAGDPCHPLDTAGHYQCQNPVAAAYVKLGPQEIEYHASLDGLDGGNRTWHYEQPFQLTLDNDTEFHESYETVLSADAYVWYGTNLAPVPEPGTAALLLVGLPALLAIGRRRRPPRPGTRDAELHPSSTRT